MSQAAGYDDPADVVPGFSPEPEQQEPQQKAKPSKRIPTIKVPTWNKKQRTPRLQKGRTMASTQPLRPYGEAKPPRQMPRAVKHSYKTAGGWLQGIQPVNSVINAVILSVVITMLHGWHLMSFKGVGMGLLFAVLELSLFSFALTCLKRSATKPPMVYLAVAVIVVMLLILGGVITRYPNELFSVLVVFAFIVAIADPVGFVNAKVSLQAEREEFSAQQNAWEAWREEQNMLIASKLEDATRTLSHARTTDEESRLHRQRLEAENDEKIADAQRRLTEGFTTSFETAIGLVELKDQYQKVMADAMASKKEFDQTHAQIREEVRAEFTQQMADLEEANRQLRLQAHGPGQIPADARPDFAQHGQPVEHLIITPDGRTVGTDQREPTG